MSGRSWKLVARRSEAVLRDQPWTVPLTDWPDEGFVQVAEGAHRHVVRFIQHGGEIFAFKELPSRLAMREYRLLRELMDDGIPVVEPVAVVVREGLEDILVTRYLNFSLPYRHLFLTRWGPMSDDDQIVSKLLDAMALLLVRMHLGGYFWGDCSLNNTLLKRDAGQLAAYVVDMETGEHHGTLSDGQRTVDLEIAEMNLAGGLMDIAAELRIPSGLDPAHTADRFRRRYDDLWHELMRDEIIGGGERYRVEERIRRLNDMGFDVDEFEVISEPSSEGVRLKLRTCVTEQGFHQRRLLELTGIRAEPNQARALLNDIASFRSWLESGDGASIPYPVAVHRWYTEVFSPTMASIPEGMADRLEGVEVFTEILELKWVESERAGYDIGMTAAVKLFLRTVLPTAPAEKVVAP